MRRLPQATKISKNQQIFLKSIDSRAKTSKKTLITLICLLAQRARALDANLPPKVVLFAKIDLEDLSDRSVKTW